MKNSTGIRIGRVHTAFVKESIGKLPQGMSWGNIDDCKCNYWEDMTGTDVW